MATFENSPGHSDNNPSGNDAEQEALEDSSGASLDEWRLHYDNGVALLEAEEYTSALSELSEALKLFGAAEALNQGGGKQAEARLLFSRSAAFLGLSRQLRQRPAALSERHALYNLDPTQLARLGLQDARRAAEMLPSSPRAFLCQGEALFQLERYPEAEEALLRGLSLEPSDPSLQRTLTATQRMLAASPSNATPPRKRKAQAEGNDDLECVLCMKLMYEPSTTPCGHSFCRGCLLRALDHNNRCPICRTVLHVGREMAVSITLKAVVMRACPEEYEQRRLEVEGLGAGEGAAPPDSYPLPLFVMSLLVPGEKMSLNIFEPRYRLLVRRCMEGSRRLGMAQQVARGSRASNVGGLEAVACEAEILECISQPDGRYHLEILGKQRVRLQQTWDLDGYRVARVTPFNDDPPAPTPPPPPASPPRSPNSAAASSQPAGSAPQGEGVHRQRVLPGGEVGALAREVDGLVVGLLDRFRGLTARRAGLSQMQALLDGLGEKPILAGDPEAFSLWVAALLNRTTNLEVAPLLATTSTLQRLTLERAVLQQAHSSASPCTIM